jgi:hypothetical protein
MDLMREIDKIKKSIKKFEDSIHSNLSVIDELKIWKEFIKKRKSKSNTLDFQNIHFNSSV